MKNALGREDVQRAKTKQYICILHKKREIVKMKGLYEITKTHLNADEIHQLIDLAVKINTTYMSNYDRPMVFISYSPHTQQIDVRVHSRGWTDDESTHDADASWTLYICSNRLYNYAAYTECKSYLEKMLETVEEQRLVEENEEANNNEII